MRAIVDGGNRVISGSEWAYAPLHAALVAAVLISRRLAWRCCGNNHGAEHVVIDGMQQIVKGIFNRSTCYAHSVGSQLNTLFGCCATYHQCSHIARSRHTRRGCSRVPSRHVSRRRAGIHAPEQLREPAARAPVALQSAACAPASWRRLV